MNSNPLPLADLLHDPVRWSGVFSIHCELFSDVWRRCWLAESVEDFVAERRLAVPNSEAIIELLREAFSPYGGGPAIYNAECTAQVELDRGVIQALSQWHLWDRDGGSLEIDRAAPGILEAKKKSHYLKFIPLHPAPHEPVVIYCHLDEFRREFRRLEIHADGRANYFTCFDSLKEGDLGPKPVPPPCAFDANPNFSATEITNKEFQRIKGTAGCMAGVRSIIQS